VSIDSSNTIKPAEYKMATEKLNLCATIKMVPYFSNAIELKLIFFESTTPLAKYLPREIK